VVRQDECASAASHIDHAWRETLKVGPQTVELFVHDPATFDYFSRVVDRSTGRLPLANMVADGVNALPAGDGKQRFTLPLNSRWRRMAELLEGYLAVAQRRGGVP
jgi:hypothetical protein